MNEQVIERVPNQVAVLRHELDNMSGQFAAALPAHIPVARFARVLMTALQQNPDLVNCTRRSLWNAAMKCAQDGLLPDSREAALIPYDGEVQYIPMIAGIRKKVRNSNDIATWDAQVVHANDHFEFELGDNPFIKHKPSLEADTGPVIAAYSIAVLKSGEKSREVMSIAAIEKVRSRSRSKKGGPWFSDYEEMVRKTVARRHSKVLPMSTDLDDLLRRDDDLYDLKTAGDAAIPDREKTITGRLDALAKLPGKSDTARTAGPDHDPDQAPAADTAPAAAGTEAARPADLDIPPALRRARPQVRDPNEPKSAAEYESYALAWIANLVDPESSRWVDEINLRNELNISIEVVKKLHAAQDARIAQLHHERIRRVATNDAEAPR